MTQQQLAARAAGQRLQGPFALFAWAVTVAWLGLAAAVLVVLPPPAHVAFAVAAVLAGVATGWVARSMAVHVGPDGITLPGRERIAWSDVDEVALVPGAITVPVVTVRVGRALADHPLDGLAGVGRASGVARRLAERVADFGGLGPVALRSTGSRPRRGL